MENNEAAQLGKENAPTPSAPSTSIPTTSPGQLTIESSSDTIRPESRESEVVENQATLPSLSFITPQARKKARNARVSVCNARCKTSLRAVRAAIKRLGWEEITQDTVEASVVWMEHHDSPMQLTPHQVCSKIEGFVPLCRKSTAAYFVNQMRDAFPHLYQFCPQTWVLRRDAYDQALALERTMSEKKGWIYICKPSAGSLGRGLQLVKKWTDLKGVLREVWPNGEEENLSRRRRAEYVVQRYVTRPLLLDGFKFDCRVYVVVTNALPLVAYIFEEGLGRFCTVQYEKPRARNLGNAFMHLTNYSVNRHSDKFQSSRAHDSGSKRSLTAILQYLEEAGGPTAATLWNSVKELCERTLLALQPGLIERYSTRQTKVGLHPHGPKGFQIIGFDILFEDNYRLRLLEVNANPSMSCLTPMADPTSKEFVPMRKPDGSPKMEISTLDYAVKVELITQSLLVANPLSHRKTMLGRQEFLERSGGLPSCAVYSEPIPSSKQRQTANPRRISDRPRRSPALQPLDFTSTSHALVTEAVRAYEILYRVFTESLSRSSLFNKAAFRGMCEQRQLGKDKTFFEDESQAEAMYESALRDALAAAGEDTDGLGMTYPQFLTYICRPFGAKLDARSAVHGLMAFAKRCRPDGEEAAADVASSSDDSPVRVRARIGEKRDAVGENDSVQC